MAKESTSFGLEPEQMQRLLKIGEETKSSKGRMNNQTDKGGMLQRRRVAPGYRELSQRRGFAEPIFEQDIPDSQADR